MRFTNIIFLLLITLSVGAQLPDPNWTWFEVAPMPKAIANNATCECNVSNTRRYVCSFGGIDTSLVYTGIGLDAFRYDVINDVWEGIPPIPDTLGKIAMGASFVKGKAYVIGGYHVFANGNEVSSDKVHVYDPVTNSWEADAASIPVAIDDQVQAVWRDSLIYVVTGWKDAGNVPNVQIFNPSTNSWQVGTPVPTSSRYTAFGASGTIVGDTIYYIGGARMGNNFPLVSSLRKGAIDPNDPANIIWTEEEQMSALGYRMGANIFKGKPMWIGGSTTSYNFDADAYNGSGIIQPEDRVVLYDIENDTLLNYDMAAPPVMDLRGLVKLSNNPSGESIYIIAGGIGPNGVVSNKTWAIGERYPVGITPIENSVSVVVYPNPSAGIFQISATEMQSFAVFNSLGSKTLYSSRENSFDLKDLPKGIYYLIISFNDGSIIGKKITLQ